MKILLIAPEVCHPWTEGRKRFVRDLSTGLLRHGDVHVLTTAAEPAPSEIPAPSTIVACRSRWQTITALHKRLPSLLKEFQPSLVCHLPYGTFRHLYRLVNVWSMRHIDRLCADVGVPCFTLMYSISQEAGVHQLRPWVRHLVLNEFRSDHRDYVVRLGLDFSGWTEPGRHRVPATPPRLLFMAGMWQPTRKHLDHVLRVRGLGLLLKAGAILSARGMRLTVAAPLFANRDLQQELRRHTDNTWPDTQLDIIGEVRTPDIYLEHDVFVFPYMREETQFTPTSVVESMRAGTPVVLPRLAFLQSLAHKGEAAYTFAAGNVSAMADAIIAVSDDPAKYQAIRRRAIDVTRESMSIERSCEDVLSLHKKLCLNRV